MLWIMWIWYTTNCEEKIKYFPQNGDVGGGGGGVQLEYREIFVSDCVPRFLKQFKAKSIEAMEIGSDYLKLCSNTEMLCKYVFWYCKA